MAIPEPSCCDGPNELLRKILLGLPEIGGGSGSAISVENEGVQLTAGVTNFDFVGAGVTATAVGNDVTVTIAGATSSNVQSGTQNIGNNVDTISVVFPVAFAGIPEVVLTISRPAAENLIYANIDEASITANGFTATLSGSTTSANFKLKWFANE